MFNFREEIETATRAELVKYLEGWGCACYDSESTELLREACGETFETERFQNEMEGYYV